MASNETSGTFELLQESSSFASTSSLSQDVGSLSSSGSGSGLQVISSGSGPNLHVIANIDYGFMLESINEDDERPHRKRKKKKKKKLKGIWSAEWTEEEFRNRLPSGEEDEKRGTSSESQSSQSSDEDEVQSCVEVFPSSQIKVKDPRLTRTASNTRSPTPHLMNRTRSYENGINSDGRESRGYSRASTWKQRDSSWDQKWNEQLAKNEEEIPRANVFSKAKRVPGRLDNSLWEVRAASSEIQLKGLPPRTPQPSPMVQRKKQNTTKTNAKDKDRGSTIQYLSSPVKSQSHGANLEKYAIKQQSDSQKGVKIEASVTKPEAQVKHQPSKMNGQINGRDAPHKNENDFVSKSNGISKNSEFQEQTTISQINGSKNRNVDNMEEIKHHYENKPELKENKLSQPQNESLGMTEQHLYKNVQNCTEYQQITEHYQEATHISNQQYQTQITKSSQGHSYNSTVQQNQVDTIASNVASNSYQNQEMQKRVINTAQLEAYESHIKEDTKKDSFSNKPPGGGLERLPPAVPIREPKKHYTQVHAQRHEPSTNKNLTDMTKLMYQDFTQTSKEKLDYFTQNTQQDQFDGHSHGFSEQQQQNKIYAEQSQQNKTLCQEQHSSLSESTKLEKESMHQMKHDTKFSIQESNQIQQQEAAPTKWKSKMQDELILAKTLLLGQENVESVIRLLDQTFERLQTEGSPEANFKNPMEATTQKQDIASKMNVGHGHQTIRSQSPSTDWKRRSGTYQAVPVFIQELEDSTLVEEHEHVQSKAIITTAEERSEYIEKSSTERRQFLASMLRSNDSYQESNVLETKQSEFKSYENATSISEEYKCNHQPGIDTRKKTTYDNTPKKVTTYETELGKKASYDAVSQKDSNATSHVTYDNVPSKETTTYGTELGKTSTFQTATKKETTDSTSSIKQTTSETTILANIKSESDKKYDDQFIEVISFQNRETKEKLELEQVQKKTTVPVVNQIKEKSSTGQKDQECQGNLERTPIRQDLPFRETQNQETIPSSLPPIQPIKLKPETFIAKPPRTDLIQSQTKTHGEQPSPIFETDNAHMVVTQQGIQGKLYPFEVPQREKAFSITGMWSSVNLGLVKERSHFWQKAEKKARPKAANRRSRIIDPNEWVAKDDLPENASFKDLPKNKFLSSGNLVQDTESEEVPRVVSSAIIAMEKRADGRKSADIFVPSNYSHRFDKSRPEMEANKNFRDGRQSADIFRANNYFNENEGQVNESQVNEAQNKLQDISNEIRDQKFAQELSDALNDKIIEQASTITSEQEEQFEEPEASEQSDGRKSANIFRPNNTFATINETESEENIFTEQTCVNNEIEEFQTSTESNASHEKLKMEEILQQEIQRKKEIEEKLRDIEEENRILLKKSKENTPIRLDEPIEYKTKYEETSNKSRTDFLNSLLEVHTDDKLQTKEKQSSPGPMSSYNLNETQSVSNGSVLNQPQINGQQESSYKFLNQNIYTDTLEGNTIKISSTQAQTNQQLDLKATRIDNETKSKDVRQVNEAVQIRKELTPIKDQKIFQPPKVPSRSSSRNIINEKMFPQPDLQVISMSSSPTPSRLSSSPSVEILSPNIIQQMMRRARELEMMEEEERAREEQEKKFREQSQQERRFHQKLEIEKQWRLSDSLSRRSPLPTGIDNDAPAKSQYEKNAIQRLRKEEMKEMMKLKDMEKRKREIEEEIEREKRHLVALQILEQEQREKTINAGKPKAVQQYEEMVFHQMDRFPSSPPPPLPPPPIPPPPHPEMLRSLVRSLEYESPENNYSHQPDNYFDPDSYPDVYPEPIAYCEYLPEPENEIEVTYFPAPIDLDPIMEESKEPDHEIQLKDPVLKSMAINSDIATKDENTIRATAIIITPHSGTSNESELRNVEPVKTDSPPRVQEMTEDKIPDGIVRNAKSALQLDTVKTSKRSSELEEELKGIGPGKVKKTASFMENKIEKNQGKSAVVPPSRKIAQLFKAEFKKFSDDSDNEEDTDGYSEGVEDLSSGLELPPMPDFKKSEDSLSSGNVTPIPTQGELEDIPSNDPDPKMKMTQLENRPRTPLKSLLKKHSLDVEELPEPVCFSDSEADGRESPRKMVHFSEVDQIKLMSLESLASTAPSETSTNESLTHFAGMMPTAPTRNQVMSYPPGGIQQNFKR